MLKKLMASLALLVVGAPAFAAPPDFTILTAAVDFSTVLTALLSVMASLAGVFIMIRGGSLILSKIRK